MTIIQDEELIQECKSLEKQLLSNQKLLQHLPLPSHLHKRVFPLKVNLIFSTEQPKTSTQNQNQSQIQKISAEHKQQQEYDEIMNNPLLYQFLELSEIIEINKDLKKTKDKMLEEQKHYKQLMQKHYKFVKPNKAQEMAQKLIRDKILRNVENVEYEMKEFYERGARSSIDSGSVGKFEAEEWVMQEKEEKNIKEQQKISSQIERLEQELKKFQL